MFGFSVLLFSSSTVLSHQKLYGRSLLLNCLPRTIYNNHSSVNDKEFQGYERLKGATSRFVHLEKFSRKFSSSLFAIRVNLRHP